MFKTKDLSNRASDTVASIVGSWKFIIIQSCIITIWIFCNTNLPDSGFPIGFLTIYKWDPYPFIFLNLTLSFQAAYTAPIIMMSQNRQASIDRANAENDYEVNRQAKNEVGQIILELGDIKKDLLDHKDITKELQRVSAEIQNLGNRLNS